MNDFLESLAAPSDKCRHSNAFVLEWMREQRTAVRVDITKIPFSSMQRWSFEADTGNIRHDSGRFFSIIGIDVETNYGIRNAWQQPIINQPEIGILGIITRKFDGVLHFLMQAKIEPGNINYVQLSPTLQATKSNYMRIHGGAAPHYLEYFTGTSGTQTRTLVDQLQSEQGARFLKKRNRNIIIEVLDDIPLYENFIWLTLGQIKELLKTDNVINMDSRTVISSISFGQVEQYKWEDAVRFTAVMDEAMLLSALDISKSYIQLDQHISWITDLKTKFELNVREIPLKSVSGWVTDEHAIYHKDRKYFSVEAVNVEIENREVVSWTQPIIVSAQEGIIGFIVKKINGVYHFLVQAKLEAGNFDILELSPTVQCITGNYRLGFNEYSVPFIDHFLYPSPSSILHSSMQSEEGGRFYREQNINMIIEVGNEFDHTKIPSNFTWMTFAQLLEFIRFNNYLNIQARSLISLIRFTK
jgi:oxidase EvaA